MERSILCIDLKSFYASCECLLLNKNPFTTPLVVASKTQGKGAITLAVTPYLKNLGVKSRGRLYEIPRTVKYIHMHPKMSYYVEKSKEVISVYLDFVSINDLHVYSVDEAFLDVTNYLDYYNLTDFELGEKILKEIFFRTGLHATCGIGENMFIAKTAMDSDAKKNKSNIAKWSLYEARERLKSMENLTDMWGIGKNMEKKLNILKIFSIKDLALYNKNKLIDKLGVIGEELWNHANAIDDAVISENPHISKNISYANSQILFKNYNDKNIKLIIMETIDNLTKRLRENNKVCLKVSLGIGYSLDINKGFYHSITFDNYTRDSKKIYKFVCFLLNKYIENYPIRKLSISLGTIKNSEVFQPSLFENSTKIINDDKLNYSIDTVHTKYGKSSLVNASALLEDSTLLDRNKKLGGHSL